jgi:ribulose 1,5-bisphosphate carboxylase large subunit-like protein
VDYVCTCINQSPTLLSFFDRERAKEKSKRIVTHIAYPSELLEDQKLVELYDGVRGDP